MCNCVSSAIWGRGVTCYHFKIPVSWFDHLIVEGKEESVIFSFIRICVADYLSNVPVEDMGMGWGLSLISVQYFLAVKTLISLCSLMITCSHSQMNVPWGMSCMALTPQPIFCVLKSCSWALKKHCFYFELISPSQTLLHHNLGLSYVIRTLELHNQFNERAILLLPPIT